MIVPGLKICGPNHSGFTYPNYSDSNKVSLYLTIKVSYLVLICSLNTIQQIQDLLSAFKYVKFSCVTEFDALKLLRRFFYLLRLLRTKVSYPYISGTVAVFKKDSL